jgi:5-formyltetrahydrofolate cyclo-ligase
MQSKADIRNRIWSVLEKKKAARFPGAKGRIPNFIGAEACAGLLAQMPIWKKARTIKANPDLPQRAIRYRALQEGKIVYMAVPRLRDDKPFIELDPKRLRCSLYVASSIKGASQYGRPVALEEVQRIDLIVCGSVAVNRGGARAGKGGGYSDLEFALLTEEKKIGRATPIVTAVHPLQIVNEEIPMTEHDIPLTAIVTPDEIIEIKSRFTRPKGIYWNMLPEEKLEGIPVLKQKKSERSSSSAL